MTKRERLESTLRIILEMHEVDIRKREAIIKNLMETIDAYTENN